MHYLVVKPPTTTFHVLLTVCTTKCKSYLIVLFGVKIIFIGDLACILSETCAQSLDNCMIVLPMLQSWPRTDSIVSQNREN